MRVEKTVKLPANPSRVWEALTKPELTKQYYFDCQAISDWQVGSPLIFKFESRGGSTIPVKGVITAVEPNRLLQHTCYAAEFEDVPAKHTIVTYKLTPQGDDTELSVTQGEFPEDEILGQHEKSWDHVLNGLQAFLARQREL
jgi:uncharacterized protein YndB with AHSA1/START domain